MVLVKDAIKHLKQYKLTDHVAVAIWQAEDVMEHAKNGRDMDVTKEEAEEIIDQMDRNQDCEYGITWQTIDNYLDELEEKREREKMDRVA